MKTMIPCAARAACCIAVSVATTAPPLLAITPGGPGTFVRGDANGDGKLDLSDAIGTLLALFSGAQSLACPDSADTDDSGRIDVSDPIHDFEYLFLGGPPPAPPFPEPGPDLTPDGLDCDPLASDFEPPRRLEPETVAGLAEVSGAASHESARGAVPVNEDLFELLSALPAGASLRDLADHPGMADFLATLEAESAVESGEDGCCTWIVASSQVPAAELATSVATYFREDGARAETIVDDPIVAKAAPLEFHLRRSGPGPSHAAGAFRGGALCSTPATDLALAVWGRATIRMNVICYSSPDLAVTEGECESSVDVEGSFQATLGISSDAGAECAAGWNPVEALSQEEARLDANGQTLFAKALSLQNGNRLAKAASYLLVGDIPLQPDGPAADFDVQVGAEQVIAGRTGTRNSALNALGGSSFATPFLGILESQGQAELFAAGQATGYARLRTEAVALYTHGHSSCPCAGDCAVIFEVGGGGAEELALGQAKDFYFVRTGSDDAFSELMQAR